MMERFGRELPAAGFAIGTDELMKALIRQKIQIPEEPEQIILLFDREQRKYAISLAKDFRGKGKRVELLEREEKEKSVGISYLWAQKAGGQLNLSEERRADHHGEFTHGREKSRRLCVRRSEIDKGANCKNEL